jgi:hypothetical protein
MKKFYNVIIVLAIPALFFILTSETDTVNGSPGGKTGSPGDNGANCTECHAGTPTTEVLWIYVPELLVSGYQAGQQYDVVVVGVDEGALKFGFEATAESSNGTKVGTFTPGIGGLNKLTNNNKAVTHTLAGSVPLSAGATAWNFKWTAPATTTGTINFYAAVNTANGNGQNTGDHIHLSSFSTSPAVGVAENNALVSLNVYPNPTSGLVTVQSPDPLNKIDVINLHGQVLVSEESSERSYRMDLSGLQKGIYFIRSGNDVQRIMIH